MKKLLIIACLCLQVYANAQLKLNYVNPATNEITIKNFGATSVDITTYRFCALFEYANIAIGNVTIVNGDLNLSADEEVTLAWNAGSGFNTSASDLGLFLPTGAFSSAASMVDFMQYGAAGQGRENVANTAGLWTAGQFLTGTGPWYYIGDGSASGLSQWSDQPPLIGPNMDVRINELDPDQPSTDTNEFIELYGAPNTVLDGLVIVFFSGADDMSYASYDLDGMSLDADGFFVLGSSTVTNVDMVFPGSTNNIQNGADAVAIYAGDAADWPTGLLASQAGIVDAMVYGTEDPQDDGLIAALTPGQLQLNASANDAFSFSRIPDGGVALDVTNYLTQNPTPGISNIPLCSGGNISLVSGELTQCSEQVNDAVLLANSSLYGESYIYILTDVNDLIISSESSGSFDLNALADGDYHLYGFSYNGTLNAGSIAAGQAIASVTSDACYSLSVNLLMAELTTCSLSICDGGVIQASNQNTYLSACVDSEADLYTFTNVNTGNADLYAYILSNTDGTIVEVLAGNSLDLNELPVGDYQIHGLAYFTGLDPNTTEAGDLLNGLSTLGDCLDLSDNMIEVHILDCTLLEGCTRLYFSEYLEGTSNNKAVEIYNPTPFPVDLSDYDLFAYANGAIDYTSVVALAGTLQPGDVFVVANSQSDPEILAVADMTAGLATFNGNDAIALSYNLETIDVIGIIGVDPGPAGWQFGIGSTVDHSLVRNPLVNAPTLDWTISQGQWLVYAATDYTHIGSHSAQACSGLAYVTFDVSAIQVEETVGVLDITVNAFNVTGDVPITIDISSSSATADLDFVNQFPLTLTFTPSVTSQIISLEIIDDLLEEDLYEYLTLLMNDDNNLASFVNQSITISIEPSDQNYPLYTIEEITNEDVTGVADSLGVFCAITGIVHGINFNPDGTEFTLIQGAGGIKVFDANNNYGYTVLEGDSIIVYGEVSQFMGMTEFFPDQIVYVSGNHTLEIPTLVTSLSEINESHMVQLTCVELADETQWTQIGSGFDVELTDGTNHMTMHVDLNTDLFNNSALQGHFNVIGIGAQLDDSSPYEDNYMFWPRSLTDVFGNVIASFDMPATIVYGDNGTVIDFTNSSEGAVVYEWDFGDGEQSGSEVVSHTYSYQFLSGVADVTIALQVTDAFGCTDVYTNTVDAVYTAVDELDASAISVYPNPSNGIVMVQSERIMNTIQLIDLNGRIVLTESNVSAGKKQLNLQALSSGVYQLRVLTEEEIFTKKIVIE